MDPEKKKVILPAAELDKAISKLIKSAVESLTQMTEDLPVVGCFGRKIVQLKPPQVTNFSYGDILNIVRKQMPLTPDHVIKICDSFVTTYPNDVFMACMVFAMLRNTEEYKAEQHDCDDFSVIFNAYAHKWHARIRTQIESVASVKKLLPPVPLPDPSLCIIPHERASTADVPAADDTKYLGGAPVGMCHGKLSADGGQHAFNFWISSEGKVIYIEPQTGEFITLGQGAAINFVYI